MLLTTLALILISLIDISLSLGHDYLSPENFDEFHNYISQMKKREIIDAILSEVGPHAAMPQRFTEHTYRRVMRVSREKLEEREHNRKRRNLQRKQRRVRVKHSVDQKSHKKPVNLAKATTTTIRSKSEFTV